MSPHPIDPNLNLNGNGNGNLNLNGNGNLNLDGNGNGNGNLNDNSNTNANQTCSTAGSDAQSCSSSSANAAANVCDNVNVNVNVNVTDTVGPPNESSVLDMGSTTFNISPGSTMLFMPDLGTQTLGGNGNIFHLDQVNDLASNGSVSGFSDGLSSGTGYGGGATGGDGGLAAGTYDPHCLPSELGGNGGYAAGGAGGAFDFSQSVTNGDTYATTAGADAAVGATGSTITQEAFTQHIILGSNIQYNSMPISITGGDSLSGTDVHHGA